MVAVWLVADFEPRSKIMEIDKESTIQEVMDAIYQLKMWKVKSVCWSNDGWLVKIFTTGELT